MASQFELLKKRRFLPMFLTQFLGAFNDNVFKQALILVLTYQAAKELGMDASLLNNLAAMLFILPFFLFSSTAGQIADKYEKSGLVRNIKILEIVITLLAAVGFIFKIYVLLFIALFLLGAQSTFFGPIKYAYLPQALHEDELVGGNGLFQTGTSLSILLGMIVAGFLVTTGDNYLVWTSAAIFVVALCGYSASRQVPNTPATNPQLNINYNLFKTTYSTVAYVKQIPILLFAVLGVSWFWFYGATVLTQIPEFTNKILGGQEYVVIFLLTLFSIGVSIGSLLCKKLTNNQVNLKLLPVGLLGLSMFAIDLYFALKNLPPVAEQLQPVSYFLADSRYYRVFFDLMMLGLAGGFYIVPLYSYLQAYAPPTHRARVIAANNIMNALFMVSSAIFAIIVLAVLKKSIPTLFLFTGLLNIVVGLFIWRNMTKHNQGLVRQDV